MHCTNQHGKAGQGASTSSSAKLLAAVAVKAALASCSTWSDLSRADNDTAIGAGAGAAVGNAVGGGPLGTVGGAVVGGAAGRYVGREQDEKARQEEAERNKKQKP
jgi:osmotically inducible lipoprotein OsmB